MLVYNARRTAPAANRGPETELRLAAPLARGTLDEVADARADPDAALDEDARAEADDALVETCAAPAPTPACVAVEVATATRDEAADDARD